MSRILTAIVGLALACQSATAMTVYYGTGDGTANADAAFADWSASAADAVNDQLDGLAGTEGAGATLTSSLGNTFRTTDDSATVFFDDRGLLGVAEGTSLFLARNGDVATFVWYLAEPSDAFGFFSRDNDGGTVTISFMDGTGTSTLFTQAGAGYDVFWGVSGLTSRVSSVLISTTDPGGNTLWDRFAYRSMVVPEPGTLALLLSGLAGLGIMSRRTSRAHNDQGNGAPWEGD